MVTPRALSCHQASEPPLYRITMVSGLRGSRRRNPAKDGLRPAFSARACGGWLILTFLQAQVVDDELRFPRGVSCMVPTIRGRGAEAVTLVRSRLPLS